MRSHFHLFVYGTLKSGGKNESVLSSCERVSAGEVGGVLYEIDGDHPALILYGNIPIEGEIWRCPNEMLPQLDAFEGIDHGLFRRVGVTVRDIGCWTYVAGPRLTKKLNPDNRITRWP